jgi:hypothetical protein
VRAQRGRERRERGVVRRAGRQYHSDAHAAHPRERRDGAARKRHVAAAARDHSDEEERRRLCVARGEEKAHLLRIRLPLARSVGFISLFFPAEE